MFGLRLTAEDADNFDDIRDLSFSNDGYEWFAGASYTPRAGVSWSAGYRQRSLAYDGDWRRLGSDRREDDQDWLDVGLQLDLPRRLLGNARLEAGFSHTQRHSSIPQFYSYERTEFYTALRWLF